MTGEDRGQEHGAVVCALVAMLERIAGDALDGPIREVGPGSVRRLGLTSVMLLKFLVAIEDEFGVVWPEDMDESVISAIDAIADYIVCSQAAQGAG
jgi:acyl carrier protein